MVVGFELEADQISKEDFPARKLLHFRITIEDSTRQKENRIICLPLEED